MSTQAQNKREILKDKVVALVKDFVKTEGGLTQYDLQTLFGNPSIGVCPEVADTLAQQEITLK
jgi:hypothetical protein